MAITVEREWIWLTEDTGYAGYAVKVDGTTVKWFEGSRSRQEAEAHAEALRK